MIDSDEFELTSIATRRTYKAGSERFHPVQKTRYRLESHPAVRRGQASEHFGRGESRCRRLLHDLRALHRILTIPGGQDVEGSAAGSQETVSRASSDRERRAPAKVSCLCFGDMDSRTIQASSWDRRTGREISCLIAPVMSRRYKADRQIPRVSLSASVPPDGYHPPTSSQGSSGR